MSDLLSRILQGEVVTILNERYHLVKVVEEVKPYSFEMALIKAGSFTMGNKETAHQVTITNPFHMMTAPVTQQQWMMVMGNNPSHHKYDVNCPVENVSWYDVQEFIKRCNVNWPGQWFRLPTEAEWEYVCRAGSTTAYCYGDDEELLSEYGWFNKNATITHPVKQLKANEWGLYDMHGNVWEWCADWYGGYPSGAVTDPMGPATGEYKVIRGGSWIIDARLCHSAFRSGCSPGFQTNNVGFRLISNA